MNYLIPFLTIFALLTSPDGYPMRVVKAQVVAILRPAGSCAPKANALIVLMSGGSICVAEPPEVVAGKVDEP